MTNHCRMYLLLLGSLLLTPFANADSSEAFCEVYLSKEATPIKQLSCNFSQRQGNISIGLKDEIVYDLTPVPDALGTFIDQNKQLVYRQSGLGKRGLIFRFPDKRIFVYWDTKNIKP